MQALEHDRVGGAAQQGEGLVLERGELCQEPERAEVDAQQRLIGPSDGARGRQEGAIAVAVLVVGIWPQPLVELMHASVDSLLQHIQQSKIVLVGG